MPCSSGRRYSERLLSLSLLLVQPVAFACSCYHRQRWLGSARRRDLFLRVLEQVRQRYQFVLGGYVVMPEHIHLLISGTWYYYILRWDRCRFSSCRAVCDASINLAQSPNGGCADSLCCFFSLVVVVVAEAGDQRSRRRPSQPLQYLRPAPTFSLERRSSSRLRYLEAVISRQQ